MNQNYQNGQNPQYPANYGNIPGTSTEIKEENVLAGAVGAFLFALVGGLAWFGLYQVGFIAGISGVLGMICALKGYSIFAKGESTKGIVISAVMTVIVIIIAWYLCLSLDVFSAYELWYEQGDIDYTVTFAESVSVAYLFLLDAEVAWSYWFNLVVGLVFCAMGIIPEFKKAKERVKVMQYQQANPYAQNPNAQNPNMQSPYAQSPEVQTPDVNPENQDNGNQDM